MQGIVPQSVPLSYSTVPLLAAPPIAGLLPAPKVKPQITVEKIAKSPQLESRVFRSFAEWEAADEELAAFFEGAIQRLAAVRNAIRMGVRHVQGSAR
jgi:hypothetical protein